ncbi:MFS transporter [Sulfobacillus harzensis]|uniref:MFS transporter n=1 Tax=Sulfobacillus harzensis TaxID=2729629 RepID=A0A7Y0Q1K2_9FIRM|nr:MFS transporter [Sulfobacillus harzensis]NMP21410.1 MFS transporter [Sulfobacillus harzensis]
MEAGVSAPVTQEAKSLQTRSVWAAVLGYAMDGLDQQVISYTLPAIMTTFALSTARGGVIASVSLWGTWLGAYLFGFLADYLGRVKTFTYSILLYAFATGVSALSPNFGTFAALRFLVGIGIGGEFGIGMALVMETWPRHLRARGGSYVAVGFNIGTLLASVVTLIVLPHFGWRGVMVVGVLPAIIAFVYRRRLKDPAMHQQVRREKQKFPLAYLFSSADRTRATIGLWFMTAVQNFGYYGIMVWMPSALEKQKHFSLAGTTLWVLLTTAGMVGGILLFGWACDKIGRKPSYIVLFLATALVIPLYFSLGNPTVLLLGGAILGVFVNGGMGGYGAILGEHFPTEARATAENFIFGSGRGIGGGFGPLLIGLLASSRSITSALGLLFIVYPIAALVVIFTVKELKGKPLVTETVES